MNKTHRIIWRDQEDFINRYVSILDDLEDKIRTNQSPNLTDFIKQIRPKYLTQDLMIRYVSLLRRMGEVKYALGVLNPRINSRVKKPAVGEIIEYAACLTRFGLEDESVARLTKIGDESNPDIYYELASAYVSKWDYLNAAKYFEKYLSFGGISPYRIFVGKVNLSAAYIYTNRIEKARVILDELYPDLKRKGYNLLCGNTLELLGHIAIIQGDFVSAERLFAEAGEQLNASNPRYKLYLEKWIVVSKMLRERGSEESLARYKVFRQHTVNLMDWNTLREIELFKAVATSDERAIKNLYYGVPFPEYRKRILFIWKKPLKLSPYFDLKIGAGAIDSKKIFDVSSGKDLYSDCRLKPGQAMHRLFQVLASDQYSPFHTTRIFSNVYPGSFYNPDSSIQLVYKIVKNLNQWFKKNQIPLSVQRGKFGYRLRSEGAYALRISIQTGLRTREDEFINDLLRFSLNENFSLQMVQEKLGITKRTASRLLSDSVKRGRIIRKGKSQSTTYTVVPNNLKCPVA